jgi:hypothetical protein
MPRWPHGCSWPPRPTSRPSRPTQIIESIRTLRVARNRAVKARTAATVQIRDLIITAPQPLRDQLADHQTLRAKAAVCARFRIAAEDVSEPMHAAKFALRSLAQRIDTLDAEIDSLDSHLEQLVAATAPRTTQLLGISTGHAGQLLITAGENIYRLHGEPSFAALCGASPIPASSGKTTRHRLNPGGDRQANRALHLIAVCRLRYRPRTRGYAQRRTQQGKSQRETMRCLKRYTAREVYHTLQADLNTLRPQQPRSSTTILCGSPSFGITRKHT